MQIEGEDVDDADVSRHEIWSPQHCSTLLARRVSRARLRLQTGGSPPCKIGNQSAKGDQHVDSNVKCQGRGQALLL